MLLVGEKGERMGMIVGGYHEHVDLNMNFFFTNLEREGWGGIYGLEFKWG